MKRLLSLLACFVSIASLPGCGSGEHKDIRQWMADSSSGLKGHVQALPELKPFPVVSYVGESQLDPFSAGRVDAAQKESSDANQPDFDRPPEQLEAFPLDSIHFIGILSMGKKKQQHALVRVDGVVYQVMKGNYMGQNFGRIVEISDNEIILMETVRDPSGQTTGWVERPMTLQLLEEGQGKGGGK